MRPQQITMTYVLFPQNVSCDASKNIQRITDGQIDDKVIPMRRFASLVQQKAVSQYLGDRIHQDIMYYLEVFKANMNSDIYYYRRQPYFFIGFIGCMSWYITVHVSFNVSLFAIHNDQYYTVKATDGRRSEDRVPVKCRFDLFRFVSICFVSLFTGTLEDKLLPDAYLRTRRSSVARNPCRK